VRVRLPEVVRARGEHLDRLVPAEAPPGAKEVADGVVAGGQTLADPREGRLLRVHPLVAVPLAQRHHAGGDIRGEKRIEGEDAVARHASVLGGYGEGSYALPGRACLRAVGEATHQLRIELARVGGIVLDLLQPGGVEQLL